MFLPRMIEYCPGFEIVSELETNQAFALLQWLEPDLVSQNVLSEIFPSKNK
jgi:hypothetical protein